MRDVEIEIGDDCYQFEVTSFHAPNREESGEITLGRAQRWLGPVSCVGVKCWEDVPTSVVLEAYMEAHGCESLREAEDALHDEAMAVVCDRDEP